MEIKLSPTLRAYVTAIHTLEGKCGRAHTGQIAERLGVSDAAATQAITRLVGVGLVRHRPYKGAHLTDKGQRVAVEMIRHHRLLETFLHQILGMPWDTIHEEAERLQAYISPEFERRIDALMEHPQFDPHGTPIPSPDGTTVAVEYKPLAEVAEADQWFELKRVSDRDSRMLRYLDDLKLRLGTTFQVAEVQPFEGPIVINARGSNHSLGRELAQHMFVVSTDAAPGNGSSRK